jgi:hypothetical protein
MNSELNHSRNKPAREGRENEVLEERGNEVKRALSVN